MQVHSVSNPDLSVRPVETRAATRTAPAERTGHPVKAESAQLNTSRALDSAPDVRPEIIERGRELFQNVPYPPTEIVTGISRLIARHWGD